MKIAALGLLLGLGLSAAKEPGGPQYDPKTEATLTGNVANVYQSGGTLEGVFLKFETKTGAVEVYLAPASFVKMLEIPLKPGLKDVDITGSKISFDGKELILARDVVIGKNTYSFRDKGGNPNWLWLTKSTPPTGE
jgi:hypothetical protein